MKNLFPLALICAIQLSYGQEIYGSLNAGYQFIQRNEQPPEPIVNTYHQIVHPNFWSWEDFCFQEAYSADVGLGFTHHNGIGFRLTAGYVQPLSHTIENVMTRMRFEGRFFRFSPSIVIQKRVKKAKIVSTFGLQLGLGKAQLTQWHKDFPSSKLGFSEAMINYEYSGECAVGFSGSIGILQIISDRVGITIDVVGRYQSFIPTKGRMMAYEVNGNDLMATNDWSPYYSEIEFGDDSELMYWSSDDISKPQKLYRKTFSLSGLGLTMGITYVIFGKDAHKGRSIAGSKVN